MNNLGFVIGSAALTFTVTNIDVFCLLVLFFAKVQVEEGSTNTNVWIAQAIGFSVIVGISLLGLALSASIETEYVSLLGVIPILMGGRSMYTDWDWVYIKQLIFCTRDDISTKSDFDVMDVEIGAVDVPTEHAGDTTTTQCHQTDQTIIDLTPSTVSGLEDLLDTISVNSMTSDQPESKVKVFLKRFFPAQLVEMLFITVANGGDNIAIYLPIFAASTTHAIVVTVIVYYALLVVWLLVAYRLLGDRRVIGLLHRYGHYLVPLCLIATGVYILSDSILFQLH